MEKPFTCENQTNSGFSSNTLVLLYVLSASMVGAPFLLPSAVKELLINNNAYYWLDSDSRITTMNSLCSLGSSSLLLSGVVGAYFIDIFNNRNTAIIAVILHIVGWIFCFFFDKIWYYFPFIGICFWGISTQLLTLTKSSISVFYNSKKHLVVAMIGGSIGMSFAYMQIMVNLVKYVSNLELNFQYFGMNPTQFVVYINCIISVLWIIGFYYIIPCQPFVTPAVDYCTRVSISRSQLMNSLSEFDREDCISFINNQMVIEINRCKEDIPYQWTLTFKEQLFSVPTIGFTIIYSFMWFVRLYFTVNMKTILLNQTGDIEYSESIVNIFGLSLGLTFIAAILVGFFVDILGIYSFLVFFVASSFTILIIFSNFIPYCFLSHLTGILLCIFCYSYFIGCSFSLFTATFGYNHLNSIQGVSSTIAGLFTLLYNFWDTYIQKHFKGDFFYPTLIALIINFVILVASIFIFLYMKRWNTHFSTHFFSLNRKRSIIK